jgi:histidine triad (HIT) family protein
MRDGCIFCEIVAGEAASSVVLENDLVLAFLDLRQFHPGHTLVIPRVHVQDIYGLDDGVLGGALMAAVARVARRLRDVLKPEGLNVWQSTGVAAGQEVPHVHFHVLPRYVGDGLLQVYPSKPGYPPRTELDALAARLRA